MASLKKILGIVLLVAAAGTIGFVIGSATRVGKGPSAVAEPTRRIEAPIEPPVERPVEAVSRSAARAPAVFAHAMDSLERLAFVEKLHREKLIALRFSILKPDGTISRQFATLFALSDAEHDELRESVTRARARLDELRAMHTTSGVRDGALVISVEPFDGGADVYDDVMDSFARILGPQRNAAFVAVQDGQLSSFFSSFGAERRSITITREATEGGAPQPRYEFQRRLADRRGVSGGSGPLDLTNPPADLRWLTSYSSTIAELPVHPRKEARK